MAESFALGACSVHASCGVWVCFGVSERWQVVAEGIPESQRVMANAPDQNELPSETAEETAVEQAEEAHQPGPPKTKVFMRKYTAAERRKRACELRAMNWSLDEIAKELGYSEPSGAWRAIQKALADLPAPSAEILRRKQVHDLLEIHRAHYPYACGMSGARDEDGSLKPPSKDAADVCIKVGTRIAALYGLDQPKSLRVEMDREMAALLDKLQKELPRDVYELVLAIASGETSGGEAEGDSEAEAGEAGWEDPEGT